MISRPESDARAIVEPDAAPHRVEFEALHSTPQEPNRPPSAIEFAPRRAAGRSRQTRWPWEPTARRDTPTPPAVPRAGPHIGGFGEEETSPAIGISQDAAGGTEAVHGRSAHIADEQIIRAGLHADRLARRAGREGEGYLRHERRRLGGDKHNRYRTFWFHIGGVGSLRRIGPKRILLEGNVAVQDRLNWSGFASWEKRRHGCAGMHPGRVLQPTIKPGTADAPAQAGQFRPDRAGINAGQFPPLPNVARNTGVSFESHERCSQHLQSRFGDGAIANRPLQPRLAIVRRQRLDNSIGLLSIHRHFVGIPCRANSRDAVSNRVHDVLARVLAQSSGQPGSSLIGQPHEMRSPQRLADRFDLRGRSTISLVTSKTLRANEQPAPLFKGRLVALKIRHLSVSGYGFLCLLIHRERRPCTLRHAPVIGRAAQSGQSQWHVLDFGAPDIHVTGGTLLLLVQRDSDRGPIAIGPQT